MDAETEQTQQSFRGNVTFDPLAFAVPVQDPAIGEVLDCDSGAFVETKSFIGGKRYEELIAERMAVRDRLVERPRFRCSLCTVPVYLVSNQLKHFFFRHVTEDGSCPAETRGELSQDEIRARKYHGVRESEPHRRIKALIERSLAADPAFSGVKKERQWRSSHDPRSRRQPDVQAIGPMGRLAFEVQLSTTFLDVVVGRQAFYRDEGALLLWVMGNFDPDYRRLTTDDLLFSNNSNIFVVDEQTAALSESARKFHVRCHFRRPVREEDRLTDSWDSQVVAFDQLIHERDVQRSWYYDYDGQAIAIRTAIGHDRQERERLAGDALRGELTAFWTARVPNVDPGESARHAWDAMRRAFAQQGILIPANPDDDTSFIALMNGLMSAKAGRPVGWNFKQLIEVAHRIADAYPQHVLSFGHAIRHFGQKEFFNSQDKSGKWQRRAAGIKQSLGDREPDFMPEPETIPLLLFLFPVIGEKVKSFAAKAVAANTQF